MSNNITLVTHVDRQLRDAVEKVAKANDRSITAELRNTLRRIYVSEPDQRGQANG